VKSGFAETDAPRPPPHPALSPRGEGEILSDTAQTARPVETFAPPLPPGRGQGEGADAERPARRSRANGAKDVTKRRPGKTAFARKLRADETEEEYFLWSDLRNRRLNGYKFARQIPLGPYVVDFLCREKRLVVELDGGQHGESGHDCRRTTWLNKQGYSVIRFWNNEVRFERAAVLDTILAVLEGRIFDARKDIKYSPATTASPPMGERAARAQLTTGIEGFKNET
jgi:very-short-patch-repair endonuclease